MSRSRAPRSPGERDTSEAAGRGHAYLADSARRALGMRGAVAQRVAGVPPPLFCAVVAALASVIAVAARPQRLPRVAALPLDAADVLLCAAAIVVQASLSERRAAAGVARSGLGAALLPVAALCSLAVVLAGTDATAMTVTAAAGCAAVVAVSAHLDSVRAAGLERGRDRALRDGLGTIVMIPVVIAGTSDALARVPRGAVVLLVAALAAAATPPPSQWRRALLPAIGVGVATAAATVPAASVPAQTTGAAGLLVLWYGLRGIVASVLGGPRDWLGLVEYVVAAAGGVAILATQLRR